MTLCEPQPEGALYLPASETLILGDLHLGWSPPVKTTSNAIYSTEIHDKIISKYTTLLQRTTPSQIIFAGDIFQRRKNTNREVQETFETLLDISQKYTDNITFISGNHDPQETPSGHTFQRSITIEDITIFHGKEPISNVNTQYIFAHLHPAENTNNHPCFVSGTENDISFIILPAFNPYLNTISTTNINWGLVPLPLSNPTIQTIPTQQ